MNYEVWLIWETGIGWCGEDMTDAFDEIYRKLMDAHMLNTRWRPCWHSFEGKEKTIVVLSYDDGLDEETAYQFVDDMRANIMRRIVVDLRLL